MQVVTTRALRTLDAALPEDVDVGRDGGEGDGEHGGGVVQPERDPGHVDGHGRDLHEEGRPAHEGQHDDERRDLGSAQLLLVVEELVHARGPSAHSARQPPGSLKSTGYIIGRDVPLER